jgi:two-component system LytT family response regulator
MFPSLHITNTTTPPLTCLLVDSNPQAALALADCVRHWPALTLAGICTSPEQAITHLQTQQVDVVFLNVEVPLFAGLALLQALSSTSPAVVLTSAYPDYGLQGCDFSVVDYLVTPIQLCRFLAVAKRLTIRSSHPQRLPTPIAMPSPTDGLYLWNAGKLVQVRLTDILYLEKLPLGCRLQTVREDITTTQPFSALAEQLPEPRFLRVNSSFVVSLCQVKPLSDSALLIDNRQIKVGPALADEMLARAFQTSQWGD